MLTYFKVIYMERETHTTQFVKSIVCSMHRINIGFSCNYQNLNILILNGTKVHDKKCKRYKRKKKLNRICGQI